MERNLSRAIFLKVLPLNNRAEVEANVVDHIRGVFCQIQQHEVKVQPNNAVIWNKQSKNLEDQGKEFETINLGFQGIIMSTFFFENLR